MLENGTIIDGKYKIVDKIGQGGMSLVYLAINERENSKWVIKEVRKEVAKDFSVIKQGLITEMNLLINLHHPNIPTIKEVIDREDALLVVMDYMEGVSLHVKLTECGAQSQETVIQWALQLCDILNYLHTKDTPIIYCDMKPSNIMLKPNGELVLIDFGVAREYKTKNQVDANRLGTKGYAAPEQYSGEEPIDARTDIYSLGVTLYHLLTNRNPSEAPYETYPIRKWDETLSSQLEEIILKCTQKNPGDRYQNCDELRSALLHCMESDMKNQRKEQQKFHMLYGCMKRMDGVLSKKWGFRKKKESQSLEVEKERNADLSKQQIMNSPTRKSLDGDRFATKQGETEVLYKNIQTDAVMETVPESKESFYITKNVVVIHGKPL